jgi:hypothetical protein
VFGREKEFAKVYVWKRKEFAKVCHLLLAAAILAVS